LFRIDDVTNSGDLSFSAVYYCGSEVGNQCWDQYILSRFDNIKIIQMLNIENFNLKHRAKLFCQTGSAFNKHAKTLLYDSTCPKNMGKWFHNKGNRSNMRLELLTAKLLK